MASTTTQKELVKRPERTPMPLVIQNCPDRNSKKRLSILDVIHLANKMEIDAHPNKKSQQGSKRLKTLEKFSAKAKQESTELELFAMDEDEDNGKDLQKHHLAGEDKEDEEEEEILEKAEAQAKEDEEEEKGGISIPIPRSSKRRSQRGGRYEIGLGIDDDERVLERLVDADGLPRTRLEFKHKK